MGVAAARALRPSIEERGNFILLRLVRRMFLKIKSLLFVILKTLLEVFGSGWLDASAT